MPTDKTDYSDLVEKSKQFLAWLHDRNINTQGTRIEKLFENLNLINEAFKSGIEPIKHLSEEEYIFTLIESNSLFKVYNEFHSYPNNFVSNEKLRTIISGPYLPSDEELGTDDTNPRNMLFELELSAFVHSFGIKILGFNDLVFEFDNKKVYVECKRIASKKRLEANIKKAASQLDNKINEENKVGLIAISLDKFSGLDKNFLYLKDIKWVLDEAYKLCDKFVKENDVVLKSVSDEKIKGYILLFKFYAQEQNKIVTPYHCYLPFIYPIVRQDTNMYRFLEKLNMKMKI